MGPEEVQTKSNLENSKMSILTRYSFQLTLLVSAFTFSVLHVPQTIPDVQGMGGMRTGAWFLSNTLPWLKKSIESRSAIDFVHTTTGRTTWSDVLALPRRQLSLSPLFCNEAMLKCLLPGRSDMKIVLIHQSQLEPMHAYSIKAFSSFRH